jgi:hypothetical protein
MRSVILAIPILFLFFPFTACDDSGTTPTPPLDLTEPANTLETVERAFNDKDSNDLALCLTDDFTFYFDKDDVGGGPGDYITIWR